VIVRDFNATACVHEQTVTVTANPEPTRSEQARDSKERQRKSMQTRRTRGRTAEASAGVDGDVNINSPYNDDIEIVIDDDSDGDGAGDAEPGPSPGDARDDAEASASTCLLDGATLDAIADIFSGAKKGRGTKSSTKNEKKNLAASVTWKPDLLLPQRDPDPSAYRTLQTTTTAKKAPPSKKELSKEWFRLPTQEITDEVKADLRVLRLRAAFDTKRFYKKDDSTKFPTQFHVGRVVEHAADFYSSRLTKKQRKATMAEEVMHDEYLSAVRKKRFNKIQEEATYWSNKASKGRKTNNPRIKKKPPRKKH